MSEDNNGSFLNGLAIGMFAGVAGFFLFGTDKGEKLRNNLEKEWQEAKVYLAKEGVIKNRDITLKDLVRELFDLENNRAVTKKRRTIKKRTKVTAKKAKKFTGV